jgi:hypothetical protein
MLASGREKATAARMALVAVVEFVLDESSS